jgi:hypothetical protein
MKYFAILLFFLPFFAAAQTVHVEDERVVYRERITVNGAGLDHLFRRAHETMNALTGSSGIKEEKDKLTSKGVIRLSSTHSLRNRLRYQLSIEVHEDSYEYRIDSVAWVTDARGKKLVITPSEKLVADMEITGPTAARTEKQLNEMDMRLQKLIVQLKKLMSL